MRLVRNEIQTPKKLVTPESRKTPAFKALMAGLGVLALGAGYVLPGIYYAGLY